MRILDEELHRDLVRRGYWGNDSIFDLVLQNEARCGDRVAFDSYSQHRSVSWTEYGSLIRRAATGLQNLGVTVDSKILLWLPDWIENHYFEEAATLLGAITVRVILASELPDVQYEIEIVRPDVIVTAGRWRGRDFPRELNECLAGTPDLNPIRVVVGPRAGVKNAITCDELIECPELVGQTLLPAQDIYLLTFTSGTTARPKCVMHIALRWMFISQCVIDAARITAADIVMGLPPHSSGMGIWAGHVLPIVAGARSVMVEKFDPTEIIQAMNELQPTVVIVVPAQLEKLLDTLDNPDIQITNSVRVIVSGAASLPPSTAQRAEAVFGCTVITVAGASDAGVTAVASVDDPPEKRWSGAVRVPPGIQYVLVDPETSAEINAPNTPGRLWASGGFWCPGYYDAGVPGKRSTDESMRPDHLDESWQTTGDLWQTDEDGFVRIVGRLSDMINRGGANISSGEVEAAVATHPAVSQVAVIPVPDPVMGERVCAVVVLKNGCNDLTLANLVSHLSAHRLLSRYKMPEHIVVRQQLPLSAGGKVSKEILKNEVVLGLDSYEAKNRFAEQSHSITTQ